MPITIDLEPVLTDRHLPHPVVAAAALRERMGLCRLSPEQRRRYQGRWFLGASGFASRAAAVRRGHEQLLGDIPYSGDDIEDQRQRVEYLEAAQITFAQLAKDIADSLLKERAVLFTMGMAVLRHCEDLLRSPFQATEHKLDLGAAVGLLRQELDRRNQKISKTKRLRLAAGTQAPPAPERPAVPVPAAAAPPAPLPLPALAAADAAPPAPVLAALPAADGAAAPPPAAPASAPTEPAAPVAAGPGLWLRLTQRWRRPAVAGPPQPPAGPRAAGPGHV